MSWFYDNLSIGWAALHHTNKRYHPLFRLWSMWAARRVLNAQGLEEIEPETYGPIFPLAQLYPSTNQANFPRLWIPNPPIMSIDGFTNLEIQKTWEEPEARIKSIAIGGVANAYETNFPDGWIFTILNGVDIDEERKLLFPGFLGLVCRGDNKGDFSSFVYRADDNDITRGPVARVHSAWRVWIPKPKPLTTKGRAINPKVDGEDALAWRLDELNPKGPGLGAITDIVGGKRKFAYCAVSQGGSISTGKSKDPHSRGLSGEGEEISAQHTSTKQIFIRPDDSGDGPILDSGEYVPCGAGPFLVETYWRFDSELFHQWIGGAVRGTWRYQTATFIAIIDEGPPPHRPPPQDETPPRRFPPTRGINSIPRGEVHSIPRGFPATDRKALTGFVSEQATPGFVYRTSALFSRGAAAIDLRSIQGAVPEEQAKAVNDLNRSLPVLMREDVITDENSVTPFSRYRAGVADGTKVRLPGNIGVEDILFRPDKIPTPKTIYDIHYKIYSGHGTPLADGGIKDGYIVRREDDGGYDFYSKAESGQTRTMSMQGTIGNLANGIVTNSQAMWVYNATGALIEAGRALTSAGVHIEKGYPPMLLVKKSTGSTDRLIGVSVGDIENGAVGLAVASGLVRATVTVVNGAVDVISSVTGELQVNLGAIFPTVGLLASTGPDWVYVRLG